MNLTITIPKTWQKDSFEVWLHKIEMKLKKQRYIEAKVYPEMLRDRNIRIFNN